MGYLIMVALNDPSLYTSRGPETAGQRLDRELNEQKEQHQREMRKMEQKLESIRRLTLMGYYE
jgi:hypothetical protein